MVIFSREDVLQITSMNFATVRQDRFVLKREEPRLQPGLLKREFALRAYKTLQRTFISDGQR